MARGWESKAVEAQMDEAGARGEGRGRADYDVSPAVRARRERLETLRLSHARTLDQLERARNPAHREMLRRTLQALEQEMTELS